MSDKIKNEIKLANFYQSLPDDMLKNAILNLDANRHYRRSLSKTKNKTEKVIIIIKEPTLRKSFTYNLYEQVREQIPLSLAMLITNTINTETATIRKSYLSIPRFSSVPSVKDLKLKSVNIFFSMRMAILRLPALNISSPIHTSNAVLTILKHL